jgi:hypothetical protein
LYPESSPPDKGDLGGLKPFNFQPPQSPLSGGSFDTDTDFDPDLNPEFMDRINMINMINRIKNIISLLFFLHYHVNPVDPV